MFGENFKNPPLTEKPKKSESKAEKSNEAGVKTENLIAEQVSKESGVFEQKIQAELPDGKREENSKAEKRDTIKGKIFKKACCVLTATAIAIMSSAAIKPQRAEAGPGDILGGITRGLERGFERGFERGAAGQVERILGGGTTEREKREINRNALREERDLHKARMKAKSEIHREYKQAIKEAKGDPDKLRRATMERDLKEIDFAKKFGY